MFLRKVVSWPNRLHNEAASGDGSNHSSRRGGRAFFRTQSAGIIPETPHDLPHHPERIVCAVYQDEQPIIDAVIAAGGWQQVRGAIVWRVSKQTIEKLYAAGCCDDDFTHVLFSAARFGRMRALTALLDHTGLNVHTLTSSGIFRTSLLYAAAQAGHADIVAALLQRGAHPNVGRFVPGLLGRRKRHSMPLETAVRGGHTRAVRMLLNHAPTSAQTKLALLDMAIGDEAKGCCQVLLEHGTELKPSAKASIDAMNDPLLSLAVRRTDALRVTPPKPA